MSNYPDMWAEAQKEILSLTAKIERLESDLENERARGIHSCGPNCQRTACVLRRQVERLEGAAKEAMRWISPDAPMHVETNLQKALKQKNTNDSGQSACGQCGSRSVREQRRCVVKNCEMRTKDAACLDAGCPMDGNEHQPWCDHYGDYETEEIDYPANPNQKDSDNGC